MAKSVASHLRQTQYAAATLQEEEMIAMEVGQWPDHARTCPKDVPRSWFLVFCWKFRINPCGESLLA